MIRIVVDEETTKSRVNILSRELNWSFEDDHDVDGLKEYLFVDYDRETKIIFVIDSIINMRYFLIEGPYENTIKELIKHQSNIISIYEDEDVLLRYKSTASSQEERIHSVYAYFLNSNKFSADRYKIMKEMLHDDDEKVRETAIVGIGYVGWEEFKKNLDEMAKQDPKPSIQEKARRMREGFDLRTA